MADMEDEFTTARPTIYPIRADIETTVVIFR